MKYSVLSKIPHLVKICFGLWDLHHLPPIGAKPVFNFNETETIEGFIRMDLWRNSD